mmetsp:Transcript_20609/g.31502  ORF Transcript_20609/g.31502 Transcript_20609/m.31502 type:complete len:210 (-) Transcript_20609:2489-3118(-)
MPRRTDLMPPSPFTRHAPRPTAAELIQRHTKAEHVARSRQNSIRLQRFKRHVRSVSLVTILARSDAASCAIISNLTNGMNPIAITGPTTTGCKIRTTRSTSSTNRKENIGRFDIMMHHTMIVYMLQTTTDIVRNLINGRQWRQITAAATAAAMRQLEQCRVCMMLLLLERVQQHGTIAFAADLHLTVEIPILLPGTYELHNVGTTTRRQ